MVFNRRTPLNLLASQTQSIQEKTFSELRLSEADARRDALRRAIALKRYRTLVRWVEKHENDQLAVALMHLNAIGKRGGSPVRAIPGGAFAYGWEMIFGTDDGPAWLVLGLDDSRWSGSIKHNRTGRELHLNLLKSTGDFRGATKTLKQSKWRETFIHEFIHWSDIEHGGMGGNLDTMGIHREKGKQAYYLSPPEFNAYYQQGAHALERNIISLLSSPVPTLHDYLRKSTLPPRAQDFVREYSSAGHRPTPIRFWNDNFIRALKSPKSDPKWMHKFKLRLASLHGLLMRKYGREIHGEGAT